MPTARSTRWQARRGQRLASAVRFERFRELDAAAIDARRRLLREVAELPHRRRRFESIGTLSLANPPKTTPAIAKQFVFERPRRRKTHLSMCAGAHLNRVIPRESLKGERSCVMHPECSEWTGERCSAEDLAAAPACNRGGTGEARAEHQCPAVELPRQTRMPALDTGKPTSNARSRPGRRPRRC